MVDPLAASVAAALVSGVTGALTDGTRALVNKLAGLVRERFRRPAEGEVLDTAIDAPENTAARRRLTELLERHLRDSPEFADRLRALQREIAARDDHAVVNTHTGEVHGSVVQARDIQGGITFR